MAITDEPRTVPEWALWNAPPAPFTVGLEEEVMLLDPDGWGLASSSEAVMRDLPADLGRHTSTETQNSVLELNGSPRATVADAVAELAALRMRLGDALAAHGLRAAAAGTHPFTEWREVHVTLADRHRAVHAAMRELARREPTFALHVHVAVPDPDDAVRAMNTLRREGCVLLALSGNSPYWQGRDTGLASARTPVFGAFPRTGTPRRFADYADWARAIDLLMACGAIPDGSHIWWDVRLQPALGTVEVRIMDAQTSVADTAPLVALVQCLVRRAVLEPEPPLLPADAPEIADENRFLAARDGMGAHLLAPDGTHPRCAPARERLDALLEACAPHAEALGCGAELHAAAALAARTGAVRQRARAEEAEGDLRAVVADLAARF